MPGLGMLQQLQDYFIHNSGYFIFIFNCILIQIYEEVNEHSGEVLQVLGVFDFGRSCHNSKKPQCLFHKSTEFF